MGKIQDAVGDKLYRMGDSGPVVEAFQLGLRDVGYALKGTGYFGPATDTAVSTFQKRAGLESDGVFGPKSAKALDAQLAGAPAPIVVPPAEVGRSLWLEAGIKLIGTKEVPGTASNKTIIDWAKEEGGDIAREYTHDSIPFCALFENHIFTKVGIKGTKTLWALDWAGKWPSVRLDGPAVGAVAPMLRDGGGHVITIVGKDQHGNIMGLGSNQSDTTSIIPFLLSRLNKGFWWPDSVPAPALIGMQYLPIVRSDGRVSINES